MMTVIFSFIALFTVAVTLLGVCTSVVSSAAATATTASASASAAAASKGGSRRTEPVTLNFNKKVSDGVPAANTVNIKPVPASSIEAEPVAPSNRKTTATISTTATTTTIPAAETKSAISEIPSHSTTTQSNTSFLGSLLKLFDWPLSLGGFILSLVTILMEFLYNTNKEEYSKVFCNNPQKQEIISQKKRILIILISIGLFARKKTSMSPPIGFWGNVFCFDYYFCIIFLILSNFDMIVAKLAMAFQKKRN
jgi:hypothetical protein